MKTKFLAILSLLLLSSFALADSDPLVQVDPSKVDLKKDVGPSSYYASLTHPPVIKPLPGNESLDITLTNLEGHKISFSDYRGKTPLVIVSASASCPIYRGVMKWVEGLRTKYGSKISVLLVYTLEAHPALDPSPYTENASGQWTLVDNVRERILVRQPTTYNQRVANANAMAKRYQLDRAGIIVDEIDNRFWTQYGKFPNSLFIVDTEGVVAFSEAWAGRSLNPVTKKPAFEEVLLRLL